MDVKYREFKIVYPFQLHTQKSCPPKKRAATTKPTAAVRCAFVAPTPSRSRRTFSVNRVLRDRVGSLPRKWG